ncbi:dipeptide/oligopeptide/nickel ABC transporter ATP-binding protein [Clostridia bacterium]|nr:dipeptide/oligopeptide/nickel ABC transporter ATP-binding protein [Clostridia bacterium]
MSDSLLAVDHLRVHFNTPGGMLRAVDDVSFHVDKGETLGLVGESGCGKSVASQAIMRLVQTPPGRYAGGSIKFKGEDTLTMNMARLRKLRGGEIGMIFQEPMAALNPVFTIASQMCEAVMLHMDATRQEARGIALGRLKQVRIAEPEHVLDSYPFMLSGGMRQRIMIAMALCCKPELLIADEPTTALDVTIQAQILNILKAARDEMGAACLFISHDLGVISHIADRVLVMYAGRVCESAPVREILKNPAHPYTIGLIASRPTGQAAGKRLNAIPGSVPSLAERDAITGCPFYPRCHHVRYECMTEPPPMREIAPGHRAACWSLK